MKKIFKKNQVVITALALMIAAAGYLSYTYSGIGDDKLKEASAELTDEDYEIVAKDTQVDAEIFTEEELDTSTDDAKKAQDAKNKDSQADDGKKNTDGENADANKKDGDSEQIDNPGETVLTSSKVSNVDFAVEAKLNREHGAFGYGKAGSR